MGVGISQETQLVQSQERMSQGSSEAIPEGLFHQGIMGHKVRKDNKNFVGRCLEGKNLIYLLIRNGRHEKQEQRQG